MIYAKLERVGNFARVVAVVETPKQLDPPRYLDISNLVPQPAVGSWYNPASASFTTLPPAAELRNVLNDIITRLETAGLVTRNF